MRHLSCDRHWTICPRRSSAYAQTRAALRRAAIRDASLGSATSGGTRLLRIWRAVRCSCSPPPGSRGMSTAQSRPSLREQVRGVHAKRFSLAGPPWNRPTSPCAPWARRSWTDARAGKMRRGHAPRLGRSERCIAWQKFLQSTKAVATIGFLSTAMHSAAAYRLGRTRSFSSRPRG